MGDHYTINSQDQSGGVNAANVSMVGEGLPGRQPLQLKVGHSYKTRGGWKALVIWERKIVSAVELHPSTGERLSSNFYVIHNPDNPDYYGVDSERRLKSQTGPIVHESNGEAVNTVALSIGAQLPTYGIKLGHPADIIEEL